MVEHPVPNIDVIRINAAVDHGYANTRPVVPRVPRHAGVDRRIRELVHSPQGMVDAYRNHVGIGFQGKECVGWHGESESLDQAEPVIQARAHALRSCLVLGLRCTLILHNDLHRLVRGRALMGSGHNRCEVRGELIRRAAVGLQSLSEDAGDQERPQAETPSPSGTVPLASIRAL